MFAVYQLAEALHKSVDEVQAMSEEQFMGWVAYFRIKQERSKR